MRWAQKQRLAFIGDRLASGALLRRADICAKFGISVPQASIDLRAFMAMNPKAIRYDKTRKGYMLDGLPIKTGRDTTSAAEVLMIASDEDLTQILLRDPDMIRDVAAALFYERH